MAESAKSWSSIGDQKSPNMKKDDLIFLNSKNLPQTFLPSNEIEIYEQYFDAETGKSRPPQPGEKAKTNILFYGLFYEQNNGEATTVIKPCVCGKMIAQKINDIQKALSAHDLISFVKITSKGTGLNTEYFAESVKVLDKPIPTNIWDKLKQDEQFKKLRPLAEIRDSLLGIKKEAAAEAPAKPAAKGSNIFNI